MKAISIVVPTLNESENIPVLVNRIADAFLDTAVMYEILFIDDHSNDDTPAVIRALAETYPIRLYQKVGERGKAFSLLQGFKAARYDTICMIDADLQYPPEAILPMYELLEESGSDMVVSRRHEEPGTSLLRRVVSKGFNLVFTRLMFGFSYDTQSGLKVFRREVIDSVDLNPTPWSFDLEFIVRALENRYKVLDYQIPFSSRLHGEAKIKVAKASYEIGMASIRLFFNSSPSKIREAYRSSLALSKRVMGVPAVLGEER